MCNKINYLIFFGLIVSSLYLLSGCGLSKFRSMNEISMGSSSFEPYPDEEYLTKKRKLSKEDRKKIEKSFRKRHKRHD